VLLVEDSGDLAAGFREGLRLVGCTPVAYCSTIAAGQPPFDIALIDHNLGRERGTTLAAWMRLQPHLATTKRVSYSATSRERIVGESQPGDFHAHRATHSLLVALVVASVMRRVAGRWPLRVLLAWLLHTLIDVPTHRRDPWGPRLLWPLPGQSRRSCRASSAGLMHPSSGASAAVGHSCSPERS
jgi:hypothetical protein